MGTGEEKGGEREGKGKGDEVQLDKGYLSTVRRICCGGTNGGGGGEGEKIKDRVGMRWYRGKCRKLANLLL